MPVNLRPPDPADLLPVPGLRLGVASAGIKKVGRRDLTLIELAEGSRVAALFTQNRFCAAPVTVCKDHLKQGAHIRALLINTGNANAGTGADGLARARLCCEAAAGLVGCAPAQVLPFSTGVILEPLPVEKILAALPSAQADFAEGNWHAAAHAIMTTDIVAKAVSRQVKLGDRRITVTGMAKGSGMIHPNMATMLAFVGTDAAVSQPVLAAILKQAVDKSFNRITVDGDTSTNDSCLLVATGAAGNPLVEELQSAACQTLQEAVLGVMTDLAQAIVRDGEGATKFITVQVRGGRTEMECTRVAYAIAHSPLVKTAFFASDPNLGRILAAIGYAGIADLDVEQIRVFLGDVLVAEHGGRAAGYDEADGARVMKEAEITITVELQRGPAETVVWTCDFSYDYVKINAEYRT